MMCERGVYICVCICSRTYVCAKSNNYIEWCIDWAQTSVQMLGMFVMRIHVCSLLNVKCLKTQTHTNVHSILVRWHKRLYSHSLCPPISFSCYNKLPILMLSWVKPVPRYVKAGKNTKEVLAIKSQTKVLFRIPKEWKKCAHKPCVPPLKPKRLIRASEMF